MVANIMGIAIICLNFYFLFYEVVCIMRDGSKQYFGTDLFNYFDLLTSGLNFWLVYETLTETESRDASIRNRDKAWTAFTVVLMWIKSFYWLRFFTKYSNYVRLIKATLFDIRRFFTVFLFLLMAFGNALLILNEGRDDESRIYDEFFGLKFIDALMNQY